MYGLHDAPAHAGVVIVGVPWEATTSYGRGTADGPAAIARASTQVDLFDVELGDPSDGGIAMLPTDHTLTRWSDEASERALEVIAAFDEGKPIATAALSRVNELSAKMERHVAGSVGNQLDQGKLVGAVGGDHSIAFGSIKAFAERHAGMGVLQFDAHADLRVAYQGFTSSHASVMHRVTSEVDIAKLVSVGVRDLCREEHDAIKHSDGRIVAFFDADIRRDVHAGTPFAEVARQIADQLPESVYVSFDIDGLDPSLCPNTGTPVPGGLAFNQALTVLSAIVESGRRIVGFDLVEVAGDEWDANVGARMLYKLIGYLKSR